MSARLSLLAIAFLTQIGAAQPAMFPPKVMEWDEVMSGYFAPTLQQVGEAPLWSEGAVREDHTVYRFTFVGNTCKSTSIRIDERAGKANLHAVRLDRCKHAKVKVLKRDQAIASADLKQLKALMDQAELWKFEIGDWDGEDGWQWTDCTFVAMERAKAGDYRISRSQISCIQPPKLMAVVNKVAAIAGQSRLSLGYRDSSLSDAMR